MTDRLIVLSRPRGLPVKRIIAVAALTFAFVAVSPTWHDRTADITGERLTGDVRIDLDRQRNEAWTASGALVDTGAMCPGGWSAERERTSVSFGSVLDPYVIERTCADGSGTLVMEHAPQSGGSWTIVDGTGAYRGAAGQGTATLVLEPAEDSPPQVILRLEGRLDLWVDANSSIADSRRRGESQ